MNPYLKNLNRIEFLVTLACTGNCKHCSEGGHSSGGEYIDGDLAAEIVHKICGNYRIESLMTFGGEALLYPEVVCKIHAAARDEQIPKRQLITNGFFSKDAEKIRLVAKQLAESGASEILLSVDAFHQETIPLEPVKRFAEAVLEEGVNLRTNPAWLVGTDADNPYNRRTRGILEKFACMGVAEANGNVIFPSGNALRYLGEYFVDGPLPENPYEEDPRDMRTISVSPNGEVLGGNVYRTDILELIEEYCVF